MLAILLMGQLKQLCSNRKARSAYKLENEFHDAPIKKLCPLIPVPNTHQFFHRSSSISMHSMIH